MADDLKWRNQHPILQQHDTVAEVVSKEQLKLTTELQALAQQYPASADYLQQLHARGKDKEACTFLAYNLHHRIAVWWGYECVVDVLTEILQKPAPVKDIADIAKPRPLRIPDFVKEAQKTAQELDDQDVDPKLMQQLNDAVGSLRAIEAQLRQIAPKEMFDLLDEVVAEQNAQFKKVHGMEPMELLRATVKKALEIEKQERETGMSARIDPNSPIFVETKAMEEKIEKIRQETVALVKAALPAVDEQQQQQDRDNCLEAVYAYIVAPDEVNAQRLLDLGNKIPDKVEGLLSLVAFWSFGDLMPLGKQVVPTPVGLMSNGLNCLLLACALQQGGMFNFAQRFARYYQFGYDCLLGKSNWSDCLQQGKSLYAQRQEQIMTRLQQSAAQQPDSQHVAAAQAAQAAAQQQPEQATVPAAAASPASTQASSPEQGQAAAEPTVASATTESATAPRVNTIAGPEAHAVQAELMAAMQQMHAQLDALVGTKAPAGGASGAAVNTAQTLAAATDMPLEQMQQQLLQELQQLKQHLSQQAPVPPQQGAAPAAPDAAAAPQSQQPQPSVQAPLNKRFRG